jgi:hypothetical protein
MDKSMTDSSPTESKVISKNVWIAAWLGVGLFAVGCLLVGAWYVHSTRAATKVAFSNAGDASNTIVWSTYLCPEGRISASTQAALSESIMKTIMITCKRFISQTPGGLAYTRHYLLNRPFAVGHRPSLVLGRQPKLSRCDCLCFATRQGSSNLQRFSWRPSKARRCKRRIGYP